MLLFFALLTFLAGWPIDGATADSGVSAMQEISNWSADLQSDVAAVRLAAARRLAVAGEDARPAAVALVRATGDAQEEIAEHAVAALEELGPPSGDDMAQLVELLEEAHDDVAYWAATLLGRLGADAAPATDALAGALNPRRALAVRERAAWALGRIGPQAAGAVAALETAAAEEHARLRRLAGEALTTIRGA